MLPDPDIVTEIEISNNIGSAYCHLYISSKITCYLNRRFRTLAFYLPKEEIMANENKPKINGNLAYKYLENYNYKIKLQNFGVKWADQTKYKKYKELVSELEALSLADVTTINKLAKDCYMEYLDLLKEKVYPVIAKAIEESGENLVKD
jgi:hypothetical protein